MVEELNSHQWSGDVYSETAIADYFTERVEDGISWTLDYNGVTFYFHPGDVSAESNGIQTATVAFAKHPELFVEKYMELTVQMKMGITIAFIIFMVLTMVLLGFWISKKQDEEMLQWMFCLLIIEVFIHLCLSPLWLEIMYGIPYMVNFFMRIIKTVVVIPLFSILGLPIVKLSKRLYKGV